MTATIITKNKTSSGTPSSLAQGELAVNIADKKMFVGGSGGSSVVDLEFDKFTGGTSLSNISIGTAATTYKLHVDAPVNSSSCRIEGVTTTSTGVNLLSLVNNNTIGSKSGYMLTLYNQDTLRGVVGLSANSGGTAFSNPYLAHTSGTGIHCAYSGSSAYNSILPCNNTGATANNTIGLGNPSVKWTVLYATNGTIQTSDRTEKQDIEALSEAETRVAVAAKGLLRKYRFIDAVNKKGNDARTHFGIIAQDLQAAFEAEGLDAGKYAMFCSDTWYEHEGETFPTQEEAPEEATEVTKLGVRYDELLAFIIAAI